MEKDNQKVSNLKKTCEICGNNAYGGKYSRHLQTQHKKVWGLRHLIKNVIKTFSEAELEQVKQLVLEIKRKQS